MKKKQKQKILVGSLILVGVIVLLYFQVGLPFSVVSSSFDAVEVSFKETSMGANFKLEGRMEGIAGETFKWSDTKIKNIDFNSKTSTGGYPKIKSLNGEFPLVTTPQESGEIYFAYDVWIRTPPSGDWAKSASTTRKGIATCKAINKGKVANEDSYYVDLECNLKVNYTCRSGSTCDLRGYTAGKVFNVFIPKVGFQKVNVYRLKNNKCNSYNILETSILPSDFLNLEECQENIINFIDVYRFENNICVKRNIDEKLKLEIDFDTMDECQENIVSKVLFYRFENNHCNPSLIFEADKTENDFETITECQSNIELSETFYRFEENQCTLINILPSQKLSNDYSTLEECDTHIDKPVKSFTAIIIGGAIFIIGLVVFLIWFFKRK